MKNIPNRPTEAIKNVNKPFWAYLYPIMWAVIGMQYQYMPMFDTHKSHTSHTFPLKCLPLWNEVRYHSSTASILPPGSSISGILVGKPKRQGVIYKIIIPQKLQKLITTLGKRNKIIAYTVLTFSMRFFWGFIKEQKGISS